VLFGHVSGAFTGATRDREGLVVMADKGTLFLDEVGEMPLDAQRVFLRVLQERRFRPVGSTREVLSDFRLVAATNRDLEAQAREGRFRADLFYRLRSFVIDLPPLAERQGDIRELALQFMLECAERDGSSLKTLSPELLEQLAAYSWPGNVRELRQAVERAMAAARYEQVLLPAHLPTEIRAGALRATLGLSVPASAGPEPRHSPALPPFREFRDARLEDIEREYLTRLAAACPGDYKAARRTAGLSKTRLYELMKKHGVSLAELPNS